MQWRWAVIIIGLLFVPGSKLTPGVTIGSQPVTPSDTRSHLTLSLAFNPVKPFMGLINLEVEYRFSDCAAVHIFMEYLLKEADHPDAVLSFGPRFYDKSDANGSDFFWGINLGYIWFRNDLGASSFTAGCEGGYRGLITDRLYLLPRGILTYPLHSRKLLLGAELLVGLTF